MTQTKANPYADGYQRALTDIAEMVRIGGSGHGIQWVINNLNNPEAVQAIKDQLARERESA